MNVKFQNIIKLSLLFSLTVGVVFTEVILQENFNDNNLDGWNVSPAGVIEVENGELHIAGGNDGFIHRAYKFTDSYFTDFEFSADVGFVSGTSPLIGLGIGSNYNTDTDLEEEWREWTFYLKKSNNNLSGVIIESDFV